MGEWEVVDSLAERRGNRCCSSHGVKEREIERERERERERRLRSELCVEGRYKSIVELGAFNLAVDKDKVCFHKSKCYSPFHSQSIFLTKICTQVKISFLFLCLNY